MKTNVFFFHFFHRSCLQVFLLSTRANKTCCRNPLMRRKGKAHVIGMNHLYWNSSNFDDKSNKVNNIIVGNIKSTVMAGLLVMNVNKLLCISASWIINHRCVPRLIMSALCLNRCITAEALFLQPLTTPHEACQSVTHVYM